MVPNVIWWFLLRLGDSHGVHIVRLSADVLMCMALSIAELPFLAPGVKLGLLKELQCFNRHPWILPSGVKSDSSSRYVCLKQGWRRYATVFASPYALMRSHSVGYIMKSNLPFLCVFFYSSPQAFPHTGWIHLPPNYQMSKFYSANCLRDLNTRTGNTQWQSPTSNSRSLKGLPKLSLLLCQVSFSLLLVPSGDVPESSFPTSSVAEYEPVCAD